MKRIFLVTCLLASLLITGCGGDDGAPSPFLTEILSDPTYDGDIARSPGGSLTVTQGNTQNVFAGVDPFTGVEHRAFLDFPLGGATGVPIDAAIVSATLDIVINSISPQPLPGSIPIRIDLVSFQPPTLEPADFNRSTQPALATTTIDPPISQADFGQHVSIDVTNLMIESQRLGLPDFQLRILLDLGATSSGLIEINDTTGPNAAALAPLLQVQYF